MVKKRTSLESLFAPASVTESKDEVQNFATEIEIETISEAIEKTKLQTPPKQLMTQRSAVAAKTKSEIVKQTVYLPVAVHEQLRQLAFEERKKMHDYLVEGLDRVFKNRGLKPYAELSDETNNR